MAGWYWHVAVRTLVGLVTSLLGLLSGAAWPQGGDPRASERVLSQRMAFFAAGGQAVGAAGERTMCFTLLWMWLFAQRMAFFTAAGQAVGAVGGWLTTTAAPLPTYPPALPLAHRRPGQCHEVLGAGAPRQRLGAHAAGGGRVHAHPLRLALTLS